MEDSEKLVPRKNGEESDIDREGDFDPRTEIGLMLITDDAINQGIAEDIIVSTLERLQKRSQSIEIVAAINISPLNMDQVRKIYPSLDDNYFEAFREFLGATESLLVIYENTNPEEREFDFIDELKRIKGKIKRHKNKGSPYGWSNAIREAIPLPGDRSRYELLDEKIDKGNLSKKDYLNLTHHLVHTPDNLSEFAELFLLMGDAQAEELLGSGRARKYIEWAKKHTEISMTTK